MIHAPDSIVEILGPLSSDPTRSAWRVRLRDGSIAVRTVSSASSRIIDEILTEYREVFEELSRE